MKKKLFLTLTSLLLIVILGVAALSGCEKQGGTDDTTAPGTTAGEQEITTQEPEWDGTLELIKDGASLVKVIRPDSSSANDPDVKAAMNIRTRLESYCADGVRVLLETDWTKDGVHDPDAVEILVGRTNYEESVGVTSTLPFGDYAVKVVGKKIVVVGYTELAMNFAANTFIGKLNSLVTGEGQTQSLSLKAADVDAAGTKDAVLSSLPVFDGGVYDSWYDPGDSCDEITLTKTSPEAFDAYVAKLKANGYTEHITREVMDNKFATLYSDKQTVNLAYYKADKKTRLIIEPFDKTTLFGAEADNKYNVVTKSQITMLGLEYQKSDGGYASNGLSILIRIADGRFIVVDGGFNSAKDMDMLIAQMKAQSADYVAKTGGIKIAGWIITHAHGDHSGAIAGQYSKLKSNNIKVERFIVNFMSDDERNKSINYYLSNGSSNWSSGEGSQWSKVYSNAAALGADIVVTHVGHIYYLADLTIETLYTIENYGPALAQAFNTTSLIMKMTFTDPETKKQTVYMSTGDATGPAFLATAKYFGKYLQSDIVQVAHHGYTTWGTEEGTMSAYRLMAPPTVLWPQGSHAYPNYVTKSYNAVLVNTSTNANYKETLVAGVEGDVTIFPMPYSVGAAIKQKAN